MNLYSDKRIKKKVMKMSLPAWSTLLGYIIYVYDILSLYILGKKKIVVINDKVCKNISLKYKMLKFTLNYNLN